MRKIISSIDIGSDSIKLVVGEFIDERFCILSAAKTPSNGIQNNKVVNKEALTNSIKKVRDETSSKLGVEIKKVILGINLFNAKCIRNQGEIKIKREECIINGNDVSQVIAKCADGKVDENYTLIGVAPEYFGVKEDTVVKDPKGIESDVLAVKGTVVVAPKNTVNDLLNACESAGLKVVDIMPNTLGDYETFRTPYIDDTNVIVVNLGYESTGISLFSKGVLMKMKFLDVGTENIVRDIAYVKKLSMKTARELYDKITLGSSRLASPNEIVEVKNLDGELIQIDQYELSEIAESRIEDMLNLIKTQINILTKKEISYIIISGGLSELKDIKLTIDNSLSNNAKIGSVNIIGARDNTFANAIGIIKYFQYKVLLRGKSFSIFGSGELEDMENIKNDINDKDNSLLSKVFGYFFDS